MGIKDNVKEILGKLPAGCGLVAAAKSRSPEEVLEAMEAGVRIIGENYLQEAEGHFQVVGRKAPWHFIGHLQKNKVKKAVALFDLIE
ncbi:MAG: YggS family pyridoxal phosphate-dependent enzyme, partial [Candidatus Contubernalis sp.]|nr:YggS family pyridoxal phosphate-dependent enzyme [Candidatus Contubernalis sp.]